jgi:hypothetical protein
MIHVAGKTITLKELEKVKMTITKTIQTRIEKGYCSGKTWLRIPHHELAKAILAEAKSRKWKVLNHRYTLSDDKNDMAGAFDLKIPGIKMPRGQTLALGVLTSNAMRRPLKIVVGTTVLVCNNGMATGEVLLNRKHTINFDLKAELHDALDEYIEKAKDIPEIVESFKSTPLSQEEVDHILLEAARRDILPWKKLIHVNKEYQEPTFPENGGENAWALLQAFTYTIKDTAVMKQLDRMGEFRGLIEEQFCAV